MTTPPPISEAALFGLYIRQGYRLCCPRLDCQPFSAPDEIAQRCTDPPVNQLTGTAAQLTEAGGLNPLPGQHRLQLPRREHAAALPVQRTQQFIDGGQILHSVVRVSQHFHQEISLK